MSNYLVSQTESLSGDVESEFETLLKEMALDAPDLIVTMRGLTLDKKRAILDSRKNRNVGKNAQKIKWSGRIKRVLFAPSEVATSPQNHIDALVRQVEKLQEGRLDSVKLQDKLQHLEVALRGEAVSWVTVFLDSGVPLLKKLLFSQKDPLVEAVLIRCFRCIANTSTGLEKLKDEALVQVWVDYIHQHMELDSESDWKTMSNVTELLTALTMATSSPIGTPIGKGPEQTLVMDILLKTSQLKGGDNRWQGIVTFLSAVAIKLNTCTTLLGRSLTIDTVPFDIGVFDFIEHVILLMLALLSSEHCQQVWMDWTSLGLDQILAQVSTCPLIRPNLISVIHQWNQIMLRTCLDAGGTLKGTTPMEICSALEATSNKQWLVKVLLDVGLVPRHVSAPGHLPIIHSMIQMYIKYIRRPGHAELDAEFWRIVQASVKKMGNLDAVLQVLESANLGVEREGDEEWILECVNELISKVNQFARILASRSHDSPVPPPPPMPPLSGLPGNVQPPPPFPGNGNTESPPPPPPMPGNGPPLPPSNRVPPPPPPMPTSGGPPPPFPGGPFKIGGLPPLPMAMPKSPFASTKPPPKRLKPGAHTLKSLDWKKLPANVIPGTIWNKIAERVGWEGEEQVRQRLGTATLEAGFGQVERIVKQVEKKPNQLLTCLDAKRSNKVGITMSKFGKVPMDDICKALIRCEPAWLVKSPDEDVADILQAIKLNCVATEDEMTQVKELCKQHTAVIESGEKKLGKAEEWVAKVCVKIPRLDGRLSSLILLLQWQAKMLNLETLLLKAKQAAEQIESSEKFFGTLAVVLAMGNYLNSDGFRGGAWGFDVEALGKLSGTRITLNDELQSWGLCKDSNMLHFMVAASLQGKLDEIVGLDVDLSACAAASKITTQSIMEDLKEMMSELTLVESMLKTWKPLDDADGFGVVLGTFATKARIELDQLVILMETTDKSITKMTKYLGLENVLGFKLDQQEQANQLKCEQVFGLINSFVDSLAKTRVDVEKEKVKISKQRKPVQEKRGVVDDILQKLRNV